MANQHITAAVSASQQVATMLEAGNDANVRRQSDIISNMSRLFPRTRTARRSASMVSMPSICCRKTMRPHFVIVYTCNTLIKILTQSKLSMHFSMYFRVILAFFVSSSVFTHTNLQ
jgi:hypothetical protein